MSCLPRDGAWGGWGAGVAASSRAGKRTPRGAVSRPESVRRAGGMDRGPRRGQHARSRRGDPHGIPGGHAVPRLQLPPQVPREPGTEDGCARSLDFGPFLSPTPEKLPGREARWTGPAGPRAQT